jgi:ribonuclease HI
MSAASVTERRIRLIAACDGACKGNPGPASWAWVIADADEQVLRWQSGPLGDATNNIGELTALEQLLMAIDATADVEVRMDSQYAINCVTTWLPGWKAKGWTTSAKKPVANKDLIMRIDALMSDRTGDVTLVYVPAHQVGGDRLNDLADRAAAAAALSQQAAQGTSADEVPEAVDDVQPRKWPSKSSNGKPSSGKPAKAGAQVVITAKFSGTCSCGSGYKAGEKIAKGPSGWGHTGCAA